MWAAVPLKSPDTAKSRLRVALDAGARTRLFLAMARHTIHTLVQTPGIARVAVVTASPEIAALAERHQAVVIREDHEAGTAHACCTAVERLSGRIESLLLISGDLPLLSASALAAFVELSGRSPVVAIAPDRHRTGTNALMCAPPGIIPISFGLDSFQQHVAAARRRRVELRIVESDALALDMDDAADLDELRHRLSADPGMVPAELLQTVLIADEAPTQ